MGAKSAFITGGAGFIGAHLAEALVADNANVTVYDRFDALAHPDPILNQTRLRSIGVRVIEGDVCDTQNLASALLESRAESVFHLASLVGTNESFVRPHDYCDVNVSGTASLVEAVRKAGPEVRRVILASSRAVYGEGACVDAEGQPANAVPRRTEDLAKGDYSVYDDTRRILSGVASGAEFCAVAPLSIYASTKLMQEKLLQQAFWGSSVEVGTLRLHNVFGPRQSLSNPYSGILSIFARQIIDGRQLEIYEDGQITRDFVLVDDVVSAFQLMADLDRLPTNPIDIGSGALVTIEKAAKKLIGHMNADPAGYYICDKFRTGDVRHAVADISQAQKVLGWCTAHSFDDGLRRFSEWCSSELEPGRGVQLKSGVP